MTTVGTLFRKLFGLDYRHPNPLARIPAWSELSRTVVAIHIADASRTRARKGWAEAKQLRPDWRVG